MMRVWETRVGVKSAIRTEGFSLSKWDEASPSVLGASNDTIDIEIERGIHFLSNRERGNGFVEWFLILLRWIANIAFDILLETLLLLSETDEPVDILSQSRPK